MLLFYPAFKLEKLMENRPYRHCSLYIYKDRVTYYLFLSNPNQMASTFMFSTTFIPKFATFSSSYNSHKPSGGSLKVSAISKKFEPTKVVPQADRVLIRLEQLPEKSAGGVLLPKSAVKFERYLMGEILSVGVEVEQVKAGKKVLFSDINAYEVDLGTDSKHCFCKAGDLLAVVE